MITNPAWFALLPAILLASLGSVSAKERIVPAVCEPVQVIAVNTALHPGKIASGALLFSDTRLSKSYSLSCADCYMLESGGDEEITGHVRFNEFGRVSSFPGTSGNNRKPMRINREKSR